MFERLKNLIGCVLLGGSVLYAAPLQAGTTCFSRAEMVWVNGSKFYVLTFGPDLLPSTRNKVANHVSAYSLAQELR
jgi:hypothetical protein